MPEVVGYARVSSVGQSLEVQREKLTAAGCTRLWAEKRSGRQADNRPELQACLAYVREGDVLVISRLDRMARSVLDLARITDELSRKGVALRVLDQCIDTGTAEGKLMLHMISAFGEFEADLRASRQRDGILLAQRNGVRFGRKAALTEEQKHRIRRLHTDEGFSVGQLQERFHVSRATVYRALGAGSETAAQGLLSARDSC